MSAIRDYFLIGDLHTAALVSNDGAIDWMCLPHFDSPSVFAAILDAEKGGSFSLNMPGYTHDTHYLPYTAIVEHTCTSDSSTFTLTDFMVPRPTDEPSAHLLVRNFRGTRGTSTINLLFDPRPNYAQQRSIITQEGNTCILMIDGRTVRVYLPEGSTVQHKQGKVGVDISFTLEEGEERAVIMEFAMQSQTTLSAGDLQKETTDFWRSWITEGNFAFSRKHLVRSAITLKLMQYYPTGGIISSPVTSLPRTQNGDQNVDGRYVSIRDATFSLYALYVLGFTKEAEKFFGFMERIAQDAKHCEGETCDLDLATTYTIWGQPLQSDTTLSHLQGHDGVGPVKIGHGEDVFSLDIYGALIDAYYFMSKRGLALSAESKDVILMLVRGIHAQWQREDTGMWNGEKGQYMYGKLMAWIGVERALRLADELNITPEQRSMWEGLKEKIDVWIRDNCHNEKHVLTQHADSNHADATNFLAVILHYMSRHSDEAKAMVEHTASALEIDGPLIARHENEKSADASMLCAYWHIAALAAVGKAEQADQLLHDMEHILPESGLMSASFNKQTNEPCGNTPEAFSHIGYILSTYYIHRYKEK